jgi:hypothetical protein
MRKSLTDIRDHALALWNVGEVASAEAVLRTLVLMRQRVNQDTADARLLQRALLDWSACLAALGQRRSAQESATMADAFAQPPKD